MADTTDQQVEDRDPNVPTVDELRDLLAAALEGLDIPYAATAGGDDRRQKILGERTVHVAIALRAVLERDADPWRLLIPLPMEVEYLRERLAEHPAEGYVTVELSTARMKAGEDYLTSVREDRPGYDPTKESESR